MTIWETARSARRLFQSVTDDIHSAMIVQRFLQNGGVVINHPPYLPDLALAKSSLFAKLKTALNGRLFKDFDGIKKNVTGERNVFPLGAFNNQ
jgi:hypothetical protein